MNAPVCSVIALALLLGACSANSGKSRSSDETPATSPLSTPATPVPLPVSTAPPARTSRIPASIRADCSVDVTDQIQTWINRVPDDYELSFAPKACYRVDGTLTLQNRHHLTIDGGDAVIKEVTKGALKRIGVAILGGSDITVRHLTVWGANPTAGARADAYHPDLVGQHGFKVGGATNVLLDHVKARDVYGDFVYIGDDNRQPSSHISVTNSTFTRSGRQGITVVDANNVTIKGNTIAGAAKTMFDIEPNSPWQEATSIHIVDNVTGSATSFWLANEGAHANVGDIEIIGNRMTAKTGGLIFEFANGGPYRDTYVIENNQFIANDKVGDQHSKGALFFAHAENITISANRVTFPAGHDMPAVELRDSHHAHVSGNTFTKAGPTMLATSGTSDYHVS